MSFIKQFSIFLVGLTLCDQVQVTNGESIELKVMSYNIWVDGRPGKQPLSQTAKVISEGEADIIGMQEVRNNASKIADLLKYNHIQQFGSNAILSKYKILGLTKDKMGARIELRPGLEIIVYNIHFRASPYQPYQLLNIPYGNGRFIKTEAEAIDEATKARGDQVDKLLRDMALSSPKNSLSFLTGDFNEPSHLDWTDKTTQIKRHPIQVSYPTSARVTKAGYMDSYRAVYPDEIKFPGMTWTPLTTTDNPKDHHDRIDFVYFKRNVGTKVKDVKIVGENTENADIVVSPYPSDHRAVVATFLIDYSHID